MTQKTSIILCTFNEVNFIEETVNELKKNIPDSEIIIVDDNSTDGTKDVIKKLNYDNKLKVIFRNKNFNLLNYPY